MTRPPSVVVVVPARDEGHAICSTVHSIAAALRHARRRGAVEAASLQVIAHRCVDDTAERARGCLQLVRCAEVVDDTSSWTIGEVRDRGARRGLARLGVPSRSCWVLSTDADTRVPRQWVVRALGQALLHRAVAVVGLAELDHFPGTPRALASYQELVASKMRSDDDTHQHDHVYGANLAVRADAYLDVGGFPHVPHAEDQRLVDLLAAAGHRVLRSRDVTVSTSGRRHGRAENGLATLLRRLDEVPDVSGQRSWAPEPVPVQ